MLKKQYLADNRACKVTFTIDHGAAAEAKVVSLVGDFNDWDTTADAMKRRKDNSFVKTVNLPCGDSYQFRYFIDGSTWENDAEADGYHPSPFGDCDNSVVDVRTVSPD